MDSLALELFVGMSIISTRSILTKTTYKAKNAAAVGVALLIAVLSDTQLSSGNFWRYSPGYGALAVHALSSTALDHTQDILSSSLGMTFTVAGSALGASVFALPFYIFRKFVVCATLLNIPILTISAAGISSITPSSISLTCSSSCHFIFSLVPYPTNRSFVKQPFVCIQAFWAVLPNCWWSFGRLWLSSFFSIPYMDGFTCRISTLRWYVSNYMRLYTYSPIQSQVCTLKILMHFLHYHVRQLRG